MGPRPLAPDPQSRPARPPHTRTARGALALAAVGVTALAACTPVADRSPATPPPSEPTPPPASVPASPESSAPPPVPEELPLSASAAASPTLAVLTRTWMDLDGQCRGGFGDDPETYLACDARDALTETAARTALDVALAAWREGDAATLSAFVGADEVDHLLGFTLADDPTCEWDAVSAKLGCEVVPLEGIPDGAEAEAGVAGWGFTTTVELDEEVWPYEWRLLLAQHDYG